MGLLASMLCLLFGCSTALTGYVSLRLVSSTSEEEARNHEKGLRIGGLLVGVAVVGLAIFAITDIARPSFNSVVFAGVGSTIGLVCVVVGLVRQRRLPEPQTDEDSPSPS